jgi:hypothetical protein
MKPKKVLSRIGVRSARPEATEPITYQAIADGLVSEMTDLLRATESRELHPPLELVIIDNRGYVAFAGEVDQHGKMQGSGPARTLRRSHFPANALITDRSLATRTFRIDRATRQSIYR